MVFEINGVKWSVVSVMPSSDCLRRSDGSFTVGVTDKHHSLYLPFKSACRRL